MSNEDETMAVAEATPREGEEFTYRGIVGRHNLGVDPKTGKSVDKPWTTIVVDFSDLQKFFDVQAFSHANLKGWQRREIKAHATALRKEIKQGTYTPTALSACVRPWHESHMEADVDEHGFEWVTLTLSEKHKLKQTDGNHRRLGHWLLRVEAEKAGDEDLVAKIDATLFPVLVSLDSDTFAEDFLNHQKGRQVDRNTLQSMRLAHGLIAGEEGSLLKLAFAVCSRMANDERSHYYKNVKFDSTQDAAKISFNSITRTSMTESATTLIGGCRLARMYKKDEAWLADIYVRAYQAVKQYGLRDKSSADPNLPVVFQEGMMACPVHLGGTLGGTAFVTGFGNLLAWWTLHHGRPEPEEQDLVRLAECVDRVFDEPTGGQSGDDKRRKMGELAREFTAPLVARGEKAVDGIAIELLRALSPGAYRVDRKAMPDEGGEDPESADLLGSIEAAVAPKRKPKADKAAPKAKPTGKKGVAIRGR